MPNERIYAPVSGDIVGMPKPGKKGLTGVEIKTPGGYHSTVFYARRQSRFRKHWPISKRDARSEIQRLLKW